ncbi:unnamed protein product, partial [marine sediment metagenome]
MKGFLKKNVDNLINLDENKSNNSLQMTAKEEILKSDKEIPLSKTNQLNLKGIVGGVGDENIVITNSSYSVKNFYRDVIKQVRKITETVRGSGENIDYWSLS